MRVIIAGGRELTQVRLVEQAVARAGFLITEVVSGAARGVDSLGESWAAQRGIPVKRFPADWDTFGSRAGLLRNQEMADYADALIAIPGVGPGTGDMIARAKRKGLQVFVFDLRPKD